MREISPLLILACLAGPEAFAKVAIISFDELIQQSEIIVVATVESISEPMRTKHFARARALEVWKGTETEDVVFLASPTWTCDVSWAETGETVLLFLSDGDRKRPHVIAHSGRGRMPIFTTNGKRYARASWEVDYPEDVPAAIGPAPEYERGLDLDALREAVRKAVQEEPEKSAGENRKPGINETTWVPSRESCSCCSSFVLVLNREGVGHEIGLLRL